MSQTDVQLPARVGPGDLLEEREELGVGVPVEAAVGHLSGDHLQGGEQRGVAVPDVVVCTPTGLLRGLAQVGVHSGDQPGVLGYVA